MSREMIVNPSDAQIEQALRYTSTLMGGSGYGADGWQGELSPRVEDGGYDFSTWSYRYRCPDDPYPHLKWFLRSCLLGRSLVSWAWRFRSQIRPRYQLLLERGDLDIELRYGATTDLTCTVHDLLRLRWPTYDAVLAHGRGRAVDVDFAERAMRRVGQW